MRNMQIFLRNEKWSSILYDTFDLKNGNIDYELESIKKNIENLKNAEKLDRDALFNKYQEYFLFSISGLADSDDEIFKLILGTSDYTFQTLHTTLPFYADYHEVAALYDIVAVVKQDSNINLNKTYEMTELSKLIGEREIIFLRKSEKNFVDVTDEFKKYLEEENSFYYFPLGEETLDASDFKEYPELSTYILSTYSIQYLIEIIRNLTIRKLVHIKELCSKKITAHRQAIEDYTELKDKCKTYQFQMLNAKQDKSNKYQEKKSE